MKLTNKQIKDFFTVSNAIEGIVDDIDATVSVFILEELLETPLEESMYVFHRNMKHLNGYCKKGVLRTYPVFVGGRECPQAQYIPYLLDALFLENPTTEEKIKQWHIDFEHIHPFGDGNGRTGRFLMLKQLIKNNLPIPKILSTMDNFEENRKEYYSWF